MNWTLDMKFFDQDVEVNTDEEPMVFKVMTSKSMSLHEIITLGDLINALRLGGSGFRSAGSDIR